MTVINKFPPFFPGHTTPPATQPQDTSAPETRHDMVAKAESPKSGNEGHPLDKIAQIVEDHVSNLIGANVRLTVERDEDANVFVYKAVDRVTGEVLRQYPAEEILKILSSYQRTEGLSVNSKA